MNHPSRNPALVRTRAVLTSRRTGQNLARWIGDFVAAIGLLFAHTTASAADPLVSLRERFLGASGLPSEVAYAESCGILPLPGSESFDWRVVFKLVYRTADVGRLADAQPVHTDCYFVRTRKYTAPVRVQPVWDGRVYQANDRLVVAAYTSHGERTFGHIDEQTRVVRSGAVEDSTSMPNLDAVVYNPFTGDLWRPARGGAIEEQRQFFLPLGLMNRQGETILPEYKVVRDGGGKFSLVAGTGEHQIVLATCAFDELAAATGKPGYTPELAPGCMMAVQEPTTVFEIPGVIVDGVLDAHASQFVLTKNVRRSASARPSVQIDGRFDEWRSVRGISDPAHDSVSYLQYNPDTDLLEFKVSSDKQFLYFYTRVVGRHGNTAGKRDRYYFYVYADADRNAATGYLPTRDDECYHGVTLGVDCEPQFEFVGGRFVKTFFGIAGHTTEKDVLTGRVALGPSSYHRYDDRGQLREGYKVEYIRRAGQIRITEDVREGTSDDITVALSPDGSECEMRVPLDGFLRDIHGKPVIAPGQRIDLAVGVESSGLIRGNSKWSSDNTVAIRGYPIAR